jgi:hypothetical protein
MTALARPSSNYKQQTHPLIREAVTRRIFGPKGDEVTGDWRNLHNEELHN